MIEPSIQNCSSMPTHERRRKACMAGDAQKPVSCAARQSRLDGALQDACTKDEFPRMSRREKRKARRAQKRFEKRKARSDALGGLEHVFSYRKLYKAGKKCCNGVRWKHSVQRFEARLFSGTAARRKKLMQRKYDFSPYVHFLLSERGKVRPIDAPRIQDRQIEKVYTQEVLLKLYLPSMIWNNGASLPGKGFHFSRKQLEKELRRHFRKYGRQGGIILSDGRKFFPSASHKHIYDRHDRLILDDELKAFGNKVVATVPGDTGMPLGVEPSQAEMIAYASGTDNYMKCQMRMKGYGHYMDDFYILVPPDVKPETVMDALYRQAEKDYFTPHPDKTRYVPLTKPFRYCKAKYVLTDTGKVVVRANRNAMPRDRKKLKALKGKMDRGEVSLADVWTSMNGMTAYLETYDEHKNVLRLRRLFYALFGFSCERYENFKTGGAV